MLNIYKAVIYKEDQQANLRQTGTPDLENLGVSVRILCFFKTSSE